MQKKSFMRGPGLWLVLLLLVVVMVQMLMWPTQVENKEISYSEFLQLVQDHFGIEFPREIRFHPADPQRRGQLL